MTSCHQYPLKIGTEVARHNRDRRSDDDFFSIVLLATRGFTPYPPRINDHTANKEMPLLRNKHSYSNETIENDFGRSNNKRHKHKSRTSKSPNDLFIKDSHKDSRDISETDWTILGLFCVSLWLESNEETIND